MKLVAFSVSLSMLGACGPKSAPTTQQPVGAVATPDAADEAPIALATMPDATADEPARDGSWSADVVLSTVQAKHMKPIKRCYKEALKKDATLRGKISIDLTIAVDGNVTHAKASGIDPTVDDCITHEAATWVFPKPPDEQTIRFTLVMVPD